MTMSRLVLELARMTGRSETLDTWLDDFGEDLVNELLLETMELDTFEQGPGHELCSYLDNAIEQLGGSLQFLRLSAGYSGRPLWKVIRYRCQLANESEGFYRCISAHEQLLRTVIQPQKQKPDAIEIHSNVVPRQAYLTRLTGMKLTCPGHELCTRGFFPTSELLHEAEPPRHCCGNCTLVEQLRVGSHTVASAAVRFWEFQEGNMCKLVDGHARLGEGSSGGEVEKVLWRRGVFVRKRFGCALLHKNLHFHREILVAMNVSHPNIVHYFGYSLWPNNREYYDLFMELLEGDLERLLLETARTGDQLSFRDTLEILLEIAEAMQHLHEKDFVHGGLKPGNILLSRMDMPHSNAQFYLVKVADFGCTQLIDPITMDSFDFKIGTLHYIAPEVLRCRKQGGMSLEQPQKIDVYSFGVIAYQVITGVTNIYPKGLRTGTIRNRIIEGSLQPDHNLCLLTLDEDCLSLFSFIQSCWDMNPGGRPSFPDICARLLLSIQNDHGKSG